MELLTHYAIIGAEKVTTDRMIDVINPYDKSVVGQVPDLDESHILVAVECAKQALGSWKEKTAKERSALLKKWYELILAHHDELAHIMTLEQGKPLAESKGEILYAASFIEWFAEEAKRVYGQVIPSPFKDSQIIVTKQPVGVCAAITPWNFPAAMITRKAGAALAAGCTMIVKPASQTPFSALALAVLAEQAGIPAGVLNVVTGKSSMIGKVFTSHPDIRKLSFTGSTAVGKQLMAQSADQIKRLSLELGGNAPFIVFEDANLEEAVTGLMASKFRNSGQTCICANRVFVHEQVQDAFLALLQKQMKTLVCGNGLNIKINQGPLIDDQAIKKASSLIQEAISRGAKLVMGGKPVGQCFEPTILVDITSEMDITREEIFAPVVSIISFKTQDEVIQAANNTPYGLAAYIYSGNWQRGWQVASELDYGMVAVNKGILSTEVAPFGGVKQSGFGREGSSFGIDEYVNVKYRLLSA